MRKTIATLATVALLGFVPAAHGAFGDDFGIAAINDGPGPAQDSDALPGLSHAFWAGVCDTGKAPAPGQPILPSGGPTGGIGGMASIVRAPDVSIGAFFPGTIQSQVPAPPSPPHCLEWPGPAWNGLADPNALWTSPPSWRLPAYVQAGAHPDGTATFSFARSGTNFNTDGSVDNIVVDLPPGFVGNPNAVAKCPSEQFDVKPPACPPESQVGILHLELLAASLVRAANLSAVQGERIYPIYNLEPRRGNIAELGFNYASSEDATSIRLVAKARTNADFGVTTFVGQIPAALPPRSQQITIWGVPWAAVNDRWRARRSLVPSDGLASGCAFQPGLQSAAFGLGPPGYYMLPAGWWDPSLPGGIAQHQGCAQSYDPSWGPIRPFISNVTECTGSDLSTRLGVDSFQNPGSFVSDGRPPDPVSGKHDLRNGDPAYPDPIDNSKPGWKVYDAPAPGLTGCGKLGFDPDITLDPVGPGGVAVRQADSPAGLDVELAIPQNNEPPAAVADDPGLAAGHPNYDPEDGAPGFWRSDAGLATSHLKDSVVTLPEGMTLNPSAADGQGVCTSEQIGLTSINHPGQHRIRFDNSDPRDGKGLDCPLSSQVATVEIEARVLDQADWPEGEVYLAAQGDNPFGSDFAIYIVVRSPERGLIVKLAGEVVPDPATGRLTTTFAENPQLPFDKFKLRFKSGPRAPLATPPVCGTHTNVSSFSPYSAPGSPRVVNDPFQIVSSPAGGCAGSLGGRPFGVGSTAGAVDAAAGRYSPFTARFTRGDGNQELDRIDLSTPLGLTAKLAGIPYCSEAGIAQARARTATGDGARERSAPSCPAASRIGTTTVGAGAGTAPFFPVGGPGGSSGAVYLAGPYRGAPLSLVFVVPAVAGPFDLGVQVVRVAVHVDRKTAKVTNVSDTIPKILRGVPLRLRDVRVDVDRGGFTLNPSSCAEKAVAGQAFGSHGGEAALGDRFQATGCTGLRFRPRLGLALTGRGQVRTGKHPGVRAVVRQTGVGEAGIRRAVVRLPKSLALDVNNASALCEFVDGMKDDLEKHCPRGSIVGRARAVTPLLDDPLAGNVYFVKNVRRDPRTGNEIRTLPMIVVALRGQIAINLYGKSSTTKAGKLVNTFDEVPDAPITQFNLNVAGGKNGILAVTRTRRARINLCAKPRGHVAEADMDGQNGRQFDRDIRMKTPCTKRQTKQAKRAAKKAARKAARARR